MVFTKADGLALQSAQKTLYERLLTSTGKLGTGFLEFDDTNSGMPALTSESSMEQHDVHCITPLQYNVHCLYCTQQPCMHRFLLQINPCRTIGNAT